MQSLPFVLTAGIAVWLVVYLFVTDGSAISATIMACAAMFAALMLKIREQEGMVQRNDPVRDSSITSRGGQPAGFETRATEAETGFAPQQTPGYATPYTLPTANNPLMNVLPPNNGEYGNQPPAAPAFNRHVERRINDAVIQNVAGSGMLNGTVPHEGDITRSKLYMDLGGEIDLADSMRTFGATPSTTTPNDQSGFAEFCYGDIGKCARGGELFCAPPPIPGETQEGGAEYKTSGQHLFPIEPTDAAAHKGLAFATTKARAQASG